MSEVRRDRRMHDAVREEGFMEIKTVLGNVLYSPQYSDDDYVFRHVTITRRMFRAVNLLLAAKPQNARFLTYDEVVDKLHIHMSDDWKHYLTHDRDLTLCFKRPRRG
eukprot:Trichotokara_eunicae@DN6020_c0_g1_i6.p1